MIRKGMMKIMTVSGIGNHPFYEQTDEKSGKKQKTKNSFYENFASNLEDRTISGRNKKGKEDSTRASGANYHFNKVSAKITFQQSEQFHTDILKKCNVRNLSYAQSEHVKLCISEGCVLKAQVDMDENKVYIEQKNEDGTIQGYEANPLELDKDTQNPIEQMALETWDEAMTKFSDFVENRIKNGPPKFSIGAEEFSIKEWEHLLEKVDESLDNAKEEAEAQQERLKEEENNRF